MLRRTLLFVLVAMTCGCWVTGGEVRDKIDEATLPTDGEPVDTADTGVTDEGSAPAR